MRERIEIGVSKGCLSDVAREVGCGNGMCLRVVSYPSNVGRSNVTCLIPST